MDYEQIRRGMWYLQTEWAGNILFASVPVVCKKGGLNMPDAMKPNCLMCDSMHPDNGNCTEVGGFCTAVPAAYCPLIPKLRQRAEKAEFERDSYKSMLEAERPCSLCVKYTGSWNPVCVRCESSTKEYRPQFVLRQLEGCNDRL